MPQTVSRGLQEILRTNYFYKKLLDQVNYSFKTTYSQTAT